MQPAMLWKDINTQHDMFFEAEVIHNRYGRRISNTWLQSSHRKDVLLQVLEQETRAKKERNSTGYPKYVFFW
jgi:hypothetical protein